MSLKLKRGVGAALLICDISWTPGWWRILLSQTKESRGVGRSQREASRRGKWCIGVSKTYNGQVQMTELHANGLRKRMHAVFWLAILLRIVVTMHQIAFNSPTALYTHSCLPRNFLSFHLQSNIYCLAHWKAQGMHTQAGKLTTQLQRCNGSFWIVLIVVMRVSSEDESTVLVDTFA